MSADKKVASDVPPRFLPCYGCKFCRSMDISLPWLIGDVEAAAGFGAWKDMAFLGCFLASAVMGFVLNYSVVLCTAYNSALTTTIIGKTRCPKAIRGHRYPCPTLDFSLFVIEE